MPNSSQFTKHFHIHPQAGASQSSQSFLTLFLPLSNKTLEVRDSFIPPHSSGTPQANARPPASASALATLCPVPGTGTAARGTFTLSGTEMAVLLLLQRSQGSPGVGGRAESKPRPGESQAFTSQGLLGPHLPRGDKLRFYQIPFSGHKAQPQKERICHWAGTSAHQGQSILI